MAQGSRRGWVRTVFAGIGAVLCAGAIGCTDVDKPKDSKLFGSNTKQPNAGLPGTAKLQGAPGTGLGTTGAANPGAGLGSGATAAGRTATGTGSNFGTGGMSSGAGMSAGGVPSNVIPSVAPQGGGGPSYTGGSGNYPNYGSSVSGPSAPSLDGVSPPPPRDGFGPVTPPANAGGTNYNR